MPRKKITKISAVQDFELTEQVMVIGKAIAKLSKKRGIDPVILAEKARQYASYLLS